MKQLAGFLMIGSLAAMVACGGDDDDGGDGDGGDADAAVPLGNPGFITPVQTPVAYLEVGGVWEEQGPADFDCLNTASDDASSAEDRTLTGKTEDFQTGDVVDNVDLGLFESGVVTGDPLETANSDNMGNYSITIPSGMTRIGFRSTDPEESRFLDTYLFNQYFAPEETDPSETLNSVSFLTANALPAFIGVMRTEGLGVLAGSFRDCQDREVQGVIATMSSTACAGNASCTPEHLDGAQTYYFSAGSTSLPVRLSQAQATNKDGLFVVIEVPPSGNGFLQVWGFPTQADLDNGDLQMLAEIASPVLADSVITTSMEPLRN